MNNEKKSIASNILIVFLILIILVSSSIGIYAWAKYTSSVNGTATAQVAKWSFKLVDGVTETTDVIDFAITRTDGYGKVVEGRLAPGTFGEFQIGIDARGTETILEYIIDVELENKPTYLKLYSDEAKTQEILVEDNKFQIKGFMSLEDVKEIRTETIYWDWPYENGDDVTDTNDAGKTVTMKISVTGYEVLEQSEEDDEEVVTQTLADVVSVGDYVNYDASSNGVQTFTNSDCLVGTSISDTISTSNDFNSNAVAQWRVLSVDKTTGIVELMSTDPTLQTVTLNDENGFTNAETILNKISSIYGKGKGAVNARSITSEDIEKYSSFDKTTYRGADGVQYGGSETYTSGNYYEEIKDGNGNVTGYKESLAAASNSNPVTMTQTQYRYVAQEYFSNTLVYNMVFKNSVDTSVNKIDYWRADRYVILYDSTCYYCVGSIVDGEVMANMVYRSVDNGSTYGNTHSVVSIVSLQTNIQTTGQDKNGVWQLKVD